MTEKGDHRTFVKETEYSFLNQLTKQGKLACPYHGPFRVIDLDTNTARIRRVDRPEEDAILVAVDRLRRCPSEVPDVFWPPDKRKKTSKKKGQSAISHPGGSLIASDAHQASGGVSNCDPAGREFAVSDGSSEVTGSSDPQVCDDSQELEQPGQTAGADVVEVDGELGTRTATQSSATQPGVGVPGRSKWAGRLRRKRQKRVFSAVGI